MVGVRRGPNNYVVIGPRRVMTDTIVANGGFESGFLAPWVVSRGDGVDVALTTTAHRGAYALSLHYNRDSRGGVRGVLASLCKSSLFARRARATRSERRCFDELSVVRWWWGFNSYIGTARASTSRAAREGSRSDRYDGRAESLKGRPISGTKSLRRRWPLVLSRRFASSRLTRGGSR